MSGKPLAMFALVLSAVALQSSAADATWYQTEREIIIGKVGDDPIEEIEQHQPLANYLAANLSDFGISVGEVRVARDIEAMAELLASGEVSIFIDSAWPAFSLADQAGAEIIARRVKEGAELRHTLFVTLTGSDIASLEDLRGQMIGLEEPDSTPGFMLPLAALLEAGLNAVEKDDREATVARNEVGYVFTGDDDNTLEWVSRGWVAAGAVDNDAFEEFTEENPDTLAILYETESVSRDQLVLVQPNMEPELVTAVTELLLGIDERDDAAAILPPETQRFDAFYGRSLSELLRLQAIYSLLAAR